MLAGLTGVAPQSGIDGSANEIATADIFPDRLQAI
jgi:hypothetical protein